MSEFIQVFEEIPSTESCTGIIVDSEETEGEGIHIYLSQLIKSWPAPGKRAIIKMDKQQARRLVAILRRAFEL